LAEQRLDASEAIMKRWREAYGDDVQPGIAAVQAATKADPPS
jgi:hypothetical protein